MLLHDPLLEVGTTVSGWAHRCTAAEIHAGWLRHCDGRPSDDRTLLLDELLDLAPPGATLQLEVKAHADPALARRTARAVCERLSDHPARERSEIISFCSGCMRARRRARLPRAAGDHRRLPPTRTRRLGKGDFGRPPLKTLPVEVRDGAIWWSAERRSRLVGVAPSPRIRGHLDWCLGSVREPARRIARSDLDVVA